MLSLAEVYDAYRTDPLFAHLRVEGRAVVPGEGSPRPRILIVGEAPGATENVQGRPFVGASGRALRSLIADSAELDPVEYFITNTVKYWPGPGNPTPSVDDIHDSIPHLREEYKALGSPPVVVAVGGVALMGLRPSGETRGILACAGEPLVFGHPEGGRWLVPMVHPSYALRNKPYRPKMEAHWEEFGKWFRREFR